MKMYIGNITKVPRELHFRMRTGTGVIKVAAGRQEMVECEEDMKSQLLATNALVHFSELDGVQDKSAFVFRIDAPIPSDVLTSGIYKNIGIASDISYEAMMDSAKSFAGKTAQLLEQQGETADETNFEIVEQKEAGSTKKETVKASVKVRA